jgi:hypothetical protein
VRNLTDRRIPTLLDRDPLAGAYGDNSNGRLGDVWQSFGPDSFRTVGISFDKKF